MFLLVLVLILVLVVRCHVFEVLVWILLLMELVNMVVLQIIVEVASTRAILPLVRPPVVLAQRGEYVSQMQINVQHANVSNQRTTPQHIPSTSTLPLKLKYY